MPPSKKTRGQVAAEMLEKCGWSFRWLGRKFETSSTTADAWGRDDPVMPDPVFTYLSECHAALMAIPVPKRLNLIHGRPMEYSMPPELAAMAENRIAAVVEQRAAAAGDRRNKAAMATSTPRRASGSKGGPVSASANARR